MNKKDEAVQDYSFDKVNLSSLALIASWINTSIILFLVLVSLVASSSIFSRISGESLMLICSFPIKKLSTPEKKD